jgi:hypothetical protein
MPMKRRKQRNIPKWKLKANWMLRELARIWYGRAEPYPLFEGENFVKAFIDIMTQSVLDSYGTEDDAWYGIECITEALSIRSTPQVLYATQTSQIYEVLARAAVLYKRPFVSGKTIRDILWMACNIETRLKSGHKPPYKQLKRLRDLSYYENLPVFPIE